MFARGVTAEHRRRS